MPQVNRLSEFPETRAGAFLVISTDDKTRASIVKAAARAGGVVLPCLTFAEAERHALEEPVSGIVVDIITMLKAKDDEKIIARTLNTIFPFLRVRAHHDMAIVPLQITQMRMPEQAGLDAFFTWAASNFVARGLRAYKRMSINIPAMVGASCCYTADISWGGAFIVDVEAGKRFAVGDKVTVSFPDIGAELPAVVLRVRPWGGRQVPGIAVQFLGITDENHRRLGTVLLDCKHSNRDRLA